MTAPAMLSIEENRLKVAVPMTFDNARQLAELGCETLGRASGGYLSIDLSAVEKVDSSALAVVLNWMRAAKTAGIDAVLVGAPAEFLSLADLYGASELFPLG